MMMENKIIIDSQKFSIDKDGIYYFDNINGNYNIDVLENIHSKIVIIGKNDYSLNINLLDNSSLIINSINNNCSNNFNINLNNNSEIVLNNSLLCENDSINKINIYHLKDDSRSLVNNNGINLGKNKLYFEVNGEVKKGLYHINCTQNNKIINYSNGDSKIIPNLIIDSNDINANHSAYIGNFDKEIRFYLESRGISDKEITKLLYKSLLLGKMDLTIEKEEFVKIINEWW